jgi:hypothetical protein
LRGRVSLTLAVEVIKRAVRAMIVILFGLHFHKLLLVVCRILECTVLNNRFAKPGVDVSLEPIRMGSS